MPAAVSLRAATTPAADTKRSRGPPKSRMCHCHRRVALPSPSLSVQLPVPMSDLTVEQAVRKEQLMWLGLLKQPFVNHHRCARRCSVPRKYRRRDRWLLGHDRRDATEASSS
ncbi:hypothetical protein PIB30_109571, partial [Stylosanthes scabra]|nr:hypothetical protein [Stylosanthes scabra]